MKNIFLIDFLGSIIVRIFSILLYGIPLRMALWIGRRMGDLAYLMNSKRRSIAYANLKAAFPEKKSPEIKKIARSHFENFGMSLIELLKVPLMGKRYLERYVTVENFERIKEALLKGKGVIILSAHSGNWEIASLAISARGHRMSIFVREQKYARLNNLLNRHRAMTGCNVITKGFSVRDIIKTLKDNGIIAMLADQDAGPSGVFVDFLGRSASMAHGVLIFSLKTGAVILPSFVRRVSCYKNVLEIGEPLELINTGDKEKDIKLNLGKIADIFGSFIKASPEYWLWSHKRWKTTPQRTVLVLSDGKAGHFNQAMAAAEMIKEALSSRLKDRGIKEEPVLKVHVVELEFRSRPRRILLDIASYFAGRWCQGRLGCLRFCLEKEAFHKIKDIYADIIVSCGASTAGANIFLRYENNAKNIHIMKPGLARNRRFNMVILPRHDAPKKKSPNILITEGAPNRITEEAMKEAVLRVLPRESHLARHGVGLLIGGDTKIFKLRKESVEEVVNNALKIAEEMNLDIFISSSRRTSGEVDAFLRDKLDRNPRCKLLVIANERNIEGALPAIFGSSEVIIVSPDSISMISEAVTSGKYVVVFKERQPAGRPGCQGKYNRSIEYLEREGYIKTAAPDEIYEVVKDFLKRKPSTRELQDRKRIIERLKVII